MNMITSCRCYADIMSLPCQHEVHIIITVDIMSLPCQHEVHIIITVDIMSLPCQHEVHIIITVDIMSTSCISHVNMKSICRHDVHILLLTGDLLPKPETVWQAQSAEAQETGRHPEDTHQETVIHQEWDLREDNGRRGNHISPISFLIQCCIFVTCIRARTRKTFFPRVAVTAATTRVAD